MMFPVDKDTKFESNSQRACHRVCRSQDVSGRQRYNKNASNRPRQSKNVESRDCQRLCGCFKSGNLSVGMLKIISSKISTGVFCCIQKNYYLCDADDTNKSNETLQGQRDN